MLNPLDIPMYFVIGVEGVFIILKHLPWPTAAEWFRWLLFLVLGKVFWYLFGDRLAARLVKPDKARQNRPNHQAAATASSLFDHH